MTTENELLTYQDSSAFNEYEDYYARDLVYRDLDLRMNFHPITNKLNPLEDDEAVKRALYNLLMTEPGEKPFNPAYGTPLNGLLFNTTFLNPLDLENQIKRSISLFEPRVNVIDIHVNDERDANEIGVTIEYEILNIDSNESFNFQIKRLR